jgi:CRISPR-associated endoribonuclease Cas6
MRFTLTLLQTASHSVLPINYQYPLSAAIYHIIERADADYSNFLHDRGYGKAGSLKKFKLFTFSDIRVPFFLQGDRLVLKNDPAKFTICFHIPDAAENFIRGLFMQQQLEIADKKSKTVFVVQGVEGETNWRESSKVKEGMTEIILQPMSPIVAGKKNAKGNYDYLFPEQDDFISAIKYNLIEKANVLQEISEDLRQQLTESILVETLFFKNPPHSRLIWIKAGTEAETKVRGWDKFKLRITAPEEIIELAMNSGIGIYNSIGMGCVGIHID